MRDFSGLNSRGSSILNVLLSVALSAIIVGGVASVVMDTQKKSQSQAQAQDIEATSNLMSQSMSNLSVCRQTLFRDGAGNAQTLAVPTAASPLVLTEIRAPGGGSMFSLNSNASARQAKMTNLEIVPIQGQDSLARVSERSLSAELRVTFQKTGSFFGSATVQKSIPLSLKIDENNRLTDCSVDSHGENVTRSLASLGTCPAGQVANGVLAVSGDLNCVPARVRQDVIVEEWEPEPADELWTWLPTYYQTTCPGLCDGQQQVSCVGRACPGNTYWHYLAGPPGAPPMPPGSTQTARPPFIGTVLGMRID